MSTEKDDDYDLGDLDQIVEDARMRQNTPEQEEAEYQDFLKSLDHLDKVVVDDIDPSEVARLRGELIALLERALLLAREIIEPAVASLIESACTRLRE